MVENEGCPVCQVPLAERLWDFLNQPFSHRQALEKYIGNQKEHHRKATFQEEFRRLLHKYGVPFDERYVWD